MIQKVGRSGSAVNYGVFSVRKGWMLTSSIHFYYYYLHCSFDKLSMDKLSSYLIKLLFD